MSPPPVVSWIWPVLSGVAASTAALIGSGLILMLGRRAERAAVWLLSFAVGTLLGAAALELLPEALEQGPTDRVMLLFLAGMVGFIVFERILRWRHPHQSHPGEPHHPEVEQATAAMILWGDALHNFIDGLVIGVSFGVSPEVGIAASVAIVAHEVPQEIGDFAILLGAGFTKRRAVALNYLSALTPIPGALLTFVWSSGTREIIGVLLPIAAGGFVYIALAGLVPAIHHRRGAKAGVFQIVLVLLGVGTIWALARLHG